MGRDIELRSVEQLAEIGACHAVMMELRPHLKDAGSFIRQVMRQREHGYRLSAAWHGDRIVGVVGYRLQENLLYGRFVFVDDRSFDVMASAHDRFPWRAHMHGKQAVDIRYGFAHGAGPALLFSPRTARPCHGLFRDTR
jgi:hypothetical protein